MERFSERLCRDIDVTGGDRDAETNERFGGAPDSRHLTGDAVDFHVAGMSDREAASNAARSGLFVGIGYYLPQSPQPHVHVDIRPGGIRLGCLNNASGVASVVLALLG